ncbi:hypothetical protein GCM10011344_24920 [Dokdonia pacifica]|uniref:Uncharacterized protein n=1 Tax=Dokdonia pacifica TaxID=1627892 RepID=A0A238WQ19_9FLAO|nr:hypothetical protein [Dokdonia pacifica]GGG23204.1 hypothetical protein GCM10011344_24920 [Dokdonia pacifica]SNR48700.1 hypothetical protein SAMN06265376_1011322 [Dokdonia pacifica]
MNDDQYYAEDFFNHELVKQIMEEFSWPIEYQLIDGDFFVQIKFPNCTIDISSDGQGGVEMEFLTYDSGKPLNITPGVIFEVTDFDPNTLELEDIIEIWPNIEDTKRQIRNRFKILQGFFIPFIKGEDYSWVEAAIKWNLS